MKKPLQDYFPDSYNQTTYMPGVRIPAALFKKINSIRLKADLSWAKFLSACLMKIADEEAESKK